MVVARKKPSAPAPPNSRTSSTQALPRSLNAKPTHSNLSTTLDNHSDPSPQSDRLTPNGISKLKSKDKSKKHGSGPPSTRKAKRSYLDRLFLPFLAIIAAYALYVCPSDVNHTSPVCHSLAIYRSHVLEPYVIPPIRAAITHPVVVQPLEKYAKPVYQNYVLPMTPYVAAAQRRTAPYINTATSFSKNATLRVWNNVIKPYWVRAVVPRYNIYVQPRVNKYISPITKRVGRYNRQVGPYVQAFAHHTSVFSHKAQRYALTTYTKVKPHAVRVYDVAKPRILRAYNQVRPLLCRVTQKARVNGKHVIGEAVALSQIALGRVGDLRRQYVDPHVLRIWEKAAEKSGSSTVVAPAKTENAVTLEDIPDVDADLEDATVEAMEQTVPPASVNPVSSSSTSDTVVNMTEEPKPPAAATISPPPPTPEETLEKVVSVAEESTTYTSGVIGEMEGEVRWFRPNVPLTPIPTPSEIPAEAPAEAPEVGEDVKSAASVVQATLHLEKTATDAAEVEDVDDFLRDLGLDNDGKEAEATPEPEPEVISPQQQEEDEEAMKAAVAEKRAAIVARHVRWQSELDTLVKDLESRVRDEIKVIRADAVKHVGALPSDKSGGEPDGKAKEVISKLQVEGEKLLKGLESYVNKLGRREIAKDELAREQDKWIKVADKVEGKFGDIVRSIQEEVHGWYMGIRELEAEVVLSAVRETKSLADIAQADLGLDYAWLEDVTYYDWQKYHDLMRTSEAFNHVARAIQNGTHTDAPEDELIPALDRLDQEVQEMIAGFALKMNSLVREGDRRLADDEPEPEPEQEGEGDEVEEEEPRVSILPVPPVPVLEHVDPGNVIIGKSKEQVEELAKQAAVDGRDEL